MPAVQLPLVGGTSGSRHLKVGRERSINCYLEASEADVALSQFPGAIAHATPGSAIRGFHVAFGRWFCVAGNTVYEVTLSGALTSLGNVNTNSGPVSMDHNISEIGIVDGSGGYVVQKSGSSVAPIVDVDFGSPSFIQYLDGYGIISGTGGQFKFTTINDFETISGTDFATAEGSPDDTLGLIVDHRELWLAGEESMEVWSTTTDTNNPIQRVPGGYLERGTLAGHSLAKLDNTVYWLGDNGEPYRANGLVPENISDPYVSSRIQSANNPGGAIGTTFEWDRHAFYQLTIPGEMTFRYDAATGKWHEGESFERSDYLGWYSVRFGGRHFVGGPDGVIYELRHDVNTMAGSIYKRARIIGPVQAGNGRLATMANVDLVMQTGVTGESDEAELMLYLSDDGGKTNPDRLTTGVGALGEYREQVNFPALGSFYERTLEFRMTDDAEFTVVSGTADIQI